MKGQPFRLLWRHDNRVSPENQNSIPATENDQFADQFWTTTAPTNFFRLSGSTDLLGENSWVLPTTNSLIDRIEGVCFSFNLQDLAELPTRIQIYKKGLNSPLPFELIGSITDFFRPAGKRSVQGRCVWVADDGQYEVQAVIVDCDGGSIIYDPRAITVGPGTGPSIVHTYTPTSNGNETFTVDTTGWTPGTHRLAIRSESLSSGRKSYPEYLEVFIEDPLNLNFANTLAQNLVDSNSVTFSNPTFRGIVESAGEFTGGVNSGLQMEAGVGFSTGRFSIWNHGNTEPYITKPWYSPGDPTLEDRTAGITTSDASSLEVTLAPNHRQLAIELQLASEEYLKYISGTDQDVCFNDAAAVSIDGVIVSLLPACDKVMALESIHSAISDSFCIPFPATAPAINSQFYISEETINEAFSFPKVPPRIEYNAATLKFKNTIFVEPGRTHQMKIVVADTDDGIAFRAGELDTALFIKSGSIKSPPLSQ